MEIRRISNDELYHHGVQGQKWGVQNGPPYPLDSSVSTGQRLKAQRKAYNSFKSTIGVKRYLDHKINVKDYSNEIKGNFIKQDIDHIKKINTQAEKLFENHEFGKLYKKVTKMHDERLEEILNDEKVGKEYDRLAEKCDNEFKKFMKTEDGKKYEQLMQQNKEKRKQMVQDILGKYAGKKIRMYGRSRGNPGVVEEAYIERMGDLVDAAIRELSEKHSMKTNFMGFDARYDRKGQINYWH